MKDVTVRAYAKINLFLAVTGREANGYHTVETVMQAISLSDRVMVAVDPDEPLLGHVSLTCSDPTLPCDGHNLAWRAAEAFETLHPVSGCIRIHIEKQIPIAGGLAGGSTDAAAVLIGLNTLCGEPLDRDALLSLGASLGADVPFCILADSGVTAAQGYHFGERMLPLAPMPDCTVVLASSGESVSTPWAYGEIDRLPPDAVGCAAAFAEQLRAGAPLDVLTDGMYNVFERAILPERPRAEACLRILTDCGARKAMMSGSGPTVFGLFSDEAQAQTAAAVLELEGARTFTAKPIR